MTTWTPADLTEGCRVSGTFYGRPFFNDDIAKRDSEGDWSVDLRQEPADRKVYIAWGGQTGWAYPVTVTDIKPAPKPEALWDDPAIPDDAWIAYEFEFDGETTQQVRSVRALRTAFLGVLSDGITNVRRVRLLNEGDVAIPRDLVSAIRSANRQRSRHYEETDLVRKIYKAILDVADAAQ